ncbi:tRNA (adenosine(37)-N6)-threonylcarbamoyltransferase complex dimerization subunit type 1 TsaB [Allomesorhizobium alhagi]|jgi:tRNA threonylcarbamoyladenosine biosynthesis protein TsaB|uniref:Peptidase M22 glycoprotease n=1 Tax=Mesorhizobium alhagi CCNWXJ12-2 TaxID=1107882 RepID=H0HJY6_9HYPH|nr:tRNA (adenosine(37)-N6)-threonylcarbamoyltransferase complex dimerization subunit type 1 TsaB [Mesorhizobium alhagi]EHK58957.1 peptidase M22 glycoprotease [Mesorhizobium alhagi CCNWXJ12-2]
MNLLAIDCSASLCAACVYDVQANRELGRSVLDLGKGHAEQLMSMVGDALKNAGSAFPDLGAVAVSVGPGSFTGVRVGVSAARGFALALKIPAIGVTTLEALAAEARDKFGTRNVLSALDGGRGEIQAAVYDGLGGTLYAPAVMTLSQAAELATEFSPVLAGTAAKLIADAVPSHAFDTGPLGATADIAIYARVAAKKGADDKPAPVYLREPDAKPQAGFILPRSGS